MEKGYLNLKGVLTFSRIGSGSVERVHLMGAELKPKGSRGLAVDARRLGEMTYVKSVQQEAKWLTDAVFNDVLQRHGLGRIEYVASSRAFRLGAHSGARTENARRQLRRGIAPRRRHTGFRVYRSEHFSCRARVGSEEFVAEERRVKDQWQNEDEDTVRRR